MAVLNLSTTSCRPANQGAHSHILMMGGVQRIFWGVKFWLKGIFLGLEDAGMLLGCGFFLGIVFFISSNQQ